MSEDQFLVSARKYRPIKFNDVIGQEQVTTTLKNALKINKISQAYLFCGPRGVGKTTCARILAKSLNCKKLSDDFEPCNECESCKSFLQNSTFNIHELDAASNNSVEDIRNLTEKVFYHSGTGNYNVYIIDEVHMLTTQAFNAFLKTLEEPPPKTIFILATTEKNKIIPTILSRCQIYNFKRIENKNIIVQLKKLCEIEGFKYNIEGLKIIADLSDGALRDALTLFDQVSISTSGNLTGEYVGKQLNVLNYDNYIKVVDNIIDQNFINIFQLFNNIIDNGYEANTFIMGLCSHYRNLLILKDEKGKEIIKDMENSLMEQINNQAKKIEIDKIYKLLECGAEYDLHYREAINKRLWVEMMLVQMASIFTQQTEDKKKTLIEINIDKESEETPKKDLNTDIKSVVSNLSNKLKVSDYLPEETKENQTENPQISNSRPQNIKTLQNSNEETKTKLNTGILSFKKKNTTDESKTQNKTENKANKVNLITPENFEERIPEFLKKIKEKYSNKSIFLTFISKSLIKWEADKISIIVSSEFEKDAIKDLNVELLDFFKEEIGNDELLLEIIVQRNEINESNQYNYDEKLRNMVTNNNYIGDLINDLELKPL